MYKQTIQNIKYPINVSHPHTESSRNYKLIIIKLLKPMRIPPPIQTDTHSNI